MTNCDSAITKTELNHHTVSKRRKLHRLRELLMICRTCHERESVQGPPYTPRFVIPACNHSKGTNNTENSLFTSG